MEEGKAHNAPKRYRPTKSLPYELREHCVIYFEEELYSQALTLLSSLLVAGTSESLDLPAFVPPPQLLALIATLTVHPDFSTKAKSAELKSAANDALHFLRSVCKLVGPVSANFTAAFMFAEKSGGRSKRHNGRGQSSLSDGERNSPGSGDEEERIKNPMAQRRSLWTRADDFWHAVGWSFNCSVKWKGGWERWKLWLEFMLEVLEDDFQERVRLMEQDQDHSETIIHESLIMQYFGKEARSSRTERRKIMRAIFAKGNDKDIAEFREVFKAETEERKVKERDFNTVRKKINLDEGDFGDYYESDDDDDDIYVKREIKEEAGLRTSIRISRSVARTPAQLDVNADVDMDDGAQSMDPVEAYGGAESLLLRRRILVLLTTVSGTLPKFFPALEEMFDIYTEFIRPLHFNVFLIFVSPIGTHGFPPAIHSSLLKMLLRPIIAVGAPRHEDNYITQEILERCYLPYAASSTSMRDNAKVSLILETLLRLLRDHASLEITVDLKQAIRKGVQTRAAKAQPDARRKGNRNEEETEAGLWLASSAKRLDMFVKMMELMQARENKDITSTKMPD